MKRIVSISALLLIAMVAFSQVPNGGFESWTNGNPDNWIANNAAPTYVTITQSTSAHSGSYAAMGQVAIVFNVPFGPLLQTGVDGHGFHYVGRPAVVTGYYQFTSVGNDEIHIFGLLARGDSAIASASGIISAGTSTYTQFTFPFTYVYPGDADSAYVQITLSNSSTNVNSGTSFLVDDIAFSGVNSVSQTPGTTPRVFALDQNYPNPFNPSTTIGYSVPTRSHVELTVYNMLGQKVQQLVNEDTDAGHFAVQFNGAGLASGIYFYRLQTRDFVQTRTFMLVK